MTDEQNQPIMDGATEATAAQKREGLEEQIAVDHRGDTAGADIDRAVREHQAGLDVAVDESEDRDAGEGDKQPVAEIDDAEPGASA
ncbi:hypothetical protein [Schumannella sp. 10F1B-5-1]|uniref:hypothetical protein n=1 Tax=Schumannella sp. 10F1B-5-1 TaxID=2590780 RepID=UPI001131A532|nr:hypothetical protein [Schumannella sp. 10F1B-5-1]TPW78333.1 hypothetical protein FJ658_00555 [Schumannella sp. 10F1B-5-1]